MSKVIKIDGDYLVFDNGYTLTHYHSQDCCENHWLDFGDLKLEDFEGLEFDLSGDDFFRRIEDYGIELVPIKGFSIKIPGYGSNNGYYSSNITLQLSYAENNGGKEWDISECQNYEPD